MSTQQMQQRAHLSVSTYQHHIQPGAIVHQKNDSDSIQCVLHLLCIGQIISKQTTKVAERLCKEVTNITQGKAHLMLKKSKEDQSIPLPVNRPLFSLSVQFGEAIYGTLHIATDSEQPTVPAIPFAVAQLMAQVCSWLLYTLEQSLFLQGQCQHLNKSVFISLTKREREVLTLMCLGHNQQSIAQKLCISPTTVGKHRQHIYEQLDVHNEHDALLAAYHFGLFSILDLPNV